MEKRPEPEDDLDLVERAARGESDAFRLMVQKHHERLFRVVRGILGDWHLSEDVCQEVFILIFRKLSSFRRDSLFSTWTHRIAVNAALRARRRRREPTLGLGLETERGGAREAVPGGPAFEAEEVVHKLLAPLPGKLRAMVVLRDQAGMSYEEISRVMRCTRGAVEQGIHRAMNILREVWKETGWVQDLRAR